MKTVWVSVLLFLLSIVAYSGFSGTLGGSADRDGYLAADLSTYLFLHRTRDESIPRQAAARGNVCPE